MLRAVRLKPWETIVGGLGVAFAAIFLFSNASGVGFGLLAAVLLWVITRIEILENWDEPGHYTAARGRLAVLKLVLLFGIYGTAFYGLLIIQHDFGSKARATVIASFAIAGLCFMLAAELWRSGDATLNWFVGSRAERAIGTKLETFKQQGWLVLHGYKRDWGDIDHVLCGPRGAYAIETKSYGYRAGDVGQAAGNAAWLKERLGVQWVTGVLCVDEDRPPWKNGKIWVVSHRDLVEWLTRYRDTPVDPAYARAKLLTPLERPKLTWRVALRARAQALRSWFVGNRAGNLGSRSS
jgi:hypothetical protein